MSKPPEHKHDTIWLSLNEPQPESHLWRALRDIDREMEEKGFDDEIGIIKEGFHMLMLFTSVTYV